jgi:monovalent cation:H+ antiporter-2, CPA2 family
MPHQTSLIATIVAGIGLAFILDALANGLRLQPIVGYLLAGVLIGPFMPGFVADQALATQLAEIGVILLPFGVGLHFSVGDLNAVNAIAIPCAIGQIIFVALLGLWLAQLLGWSLGAGVVFGLALSVASTVVVLRDLQERRLIGYGTSSIGRRMAYRAHLAMVLALVLLPPLAGLLGGETLPEARGWIYRMAKGLHELTKPSRVSSMVRIYA